MCTLHAACFSILFSWIWRIYQGCPASLRRGSTCFCTAWCSQRHRHLPGGSADWPRICGILWLWPSWWGTWGSKFYTSTLVHSKKKANPQIKRPCNIQYPSPWRVWCFEAKTIKRQLTQWKHIVRKHSENMKTTQFPAPATGGRKEFEHEGNALQVTTSNTQQFWDTNTFQSHKGHLLYLGTSRNLKGQYMSVYSTIFDWWYWQKTSLMSQKRRILDFHIGWQMPTKLIMCVDIAIIFVSSFLNGIDPSPVKPASHLQWVCSKLRCPRSFGCPVCPQHLPPEVAHSFGARRIQITERFRTPPVTQDNQIYIKYIGEKGK